MVQGARAGRACGRLHGQPGRRPRGRQHRRLQPDRVDPHVDERPLAADDDSLRDARARGKPVAGGAGHRRGEPGQRRHHECCGRQRRAARRQRQQRRGCQLRESPRRHPQPDPVCPRDAGAEPGAVARSQHRRPRKPARRADPAACRREDVPAAQPAQVPAPADVHAPARYDQQRRCPLDRRAEQRHSRRKRPPVRPFWKQRNQRLLRIRAAPRRGRHPCVPAGSVVGAAGAPAVAGRKRRRSRDQRAKPAEGSTRSGGHQSVRGLQPTGRRVIRRLRGSRDCANAQDPGHPGAVGRDDRGDRGSPCWRIDLRHRKHRAVGERVACHRLRRASWVGGDVEREREAGRRGRDQRVVRERDGRVRRAVEHARSAPAGGRAELEPAERVQRRQAAARAPRLGDSRVAASVAVPNHAPVRPDPKRRARGRDRPTDRAGRCPDGRSERPADPRGPRAGRDADADAIDDGRHPETGIRVMGAPQHGRRAEPGWIVQYHRCALPDAARQRPMELDERCDLRPALRTAEDRRTARVS